MLKVHDKHIKSINLRIKTNYVTFGIVYITDDLLFISLRVCCLLRFPLSNLVGVNSRFLCTISDESIRKIFVLWSDVREGRDQPKQKLLEGGKWRNYIIACGKRGY